MFEDAIVHELPIKDSVVRNEIALLRYRERIGLTYQEALDEPSEAIEHAFVIWDLDRQHAKLKEKHN